MGRKRTPGLYKRKEIWHIDKEIDGRRICESTGTNNLEEAERYVARLRESLRQAMCYGVRPSRAFREAATRYLLENQDKRSIADEALHLKQLDSFIGHLQLDQICMETLKPFIEARKAIGRKTKTINLALGPVKFGCYGMAG